jgi:hypothetical protein
VSAWGDLAARVRRWRLSLQLSRALAKRRAGRAERQRIARLAAKTRADNRFARAAQVATTRDSGAIGA